MSKSDKPKLTSVFLNGIITENPTFRLVLGTCPTIATTTSVINAVGMGAAASFVLIGSNFVISLLRNFIPDKVRIPCFIVVICTFVTIVQLLLQAFVQSLYASLGMFIPLIVVNCIILARAEAFASKNGPLASRWTALAGPGLAPAISIIACVRELLGTGCIAGINLLGAGYEPMLISTMAPGRLYDIRPHPRRGQHHNEEHRKEKESKGGRINDSCNANQQLRQRAALLRELCAEP